MPETQEIATEETTESEKIAKLRLPASDKTGEELPDENK